MDYSKFKSLLDDQMTWPDYYQFKFVVKTTEKNKVLDLIKDTKITEKLSKNGKYTSISARKIFNDSSEVIEVYKKVCALPGVITL